MEEEEMMSAAVLMANGTEEEWVDIKDVIVGEEGLVTVVGDDDHVLAFYAPGAWLRIEFKK